MIKLFVLLACLISIECYSQPLNALPAREVSYVREASPDTIRAVQKRFRRARGWGIACVITGSVLTPYLIVNAINYEPEVISNKNGVTITKDDSANNVISVFNGFIVTGTGIWMWQSHSKKKEAVLIEDYKNGYPLPLKVVRSLKAKDFR